MICIFSQEPTDQCENFHHSDLIPGNVSDLCRYCDYGFEIFLKQVGVDLLPYQKELLKEYIRSEKTIYVTYPSKLDRTNFKILSEMTRLIINSD